VAIELAGSQDRVLVMRVLRPHILRKVDLCAGLGIPYAAVWHYRMRSSDLKLLYTDGRIGDKNMMCCELCGETTECVQREVDGELVAICETCPIAERVSAHACVETAEQPDQIDEYEETLI
jgi:hypothetical protein